jgi:hypothetical protein
MTQIIDLENDELVSLAKACRFLDRVPSPATLWRWRTKGIKNINGERVRLECVRVGRMWCTTRKAVADFIRRSTDAASPNASDNDSQAKRSNCIESKLRSAGLAE